MTGLFGLFALARHRVKTMGWLTAVLLAALTPSLPSIGLAEELFLSPAATQPVSFNDNNWWVGFGLPGASGPVHALAVHNGTLVAGGDFSTIGHAVTQSVGQWNGDEWEPMGRGIDGTVYALATYKGDLIAAGSFLTADGKDALCIARWDGSEWYPMNDGLNRSVKALAVWNSELYVAGSFTHSGVIELAHIARWDGESWKPVGSGVERHTVNAMMVHDGKLVIGGHFTEVSGVSATHLAAWDGANWGAIAEGIDEFSSVYSLSVLDGDLIAGGQFLFVGGGRAKNIARWDGESWSPMGEGLPRKVIDLEVFEGKLIAAGESNNHDHESSFLFMWDGTAWQDTLSTIRLSVRALQVYDGKLFVGGDFSTGSGGAGSRLASWDGEHWFGFTGHALRVEIRALASFQGEPYAAGRYFVGRYDGNAWRSVGGAEVLATDLHIHKGNLIMAGPFGRLGDVSAPSIGRWDGDSWFGMGGGVHSDHEYEAAIVFTMADYDGQLAVGGRFDEVDDVRANNVARWDGEVWSPLGLGIEGEVHALVQYGDDLVAGGSFTHAEEISTRNIAAWDGSSWGPMGEGVDDEVTALVVYEDDLIAGGSFMTAGSSVSNHIARWDGSSWAPMGSGLNAPVTSLTVYNGTLIVGGRFTEAGETASSLVARWEGDTWTRLGSGLRRRSPGTMLDPWVNDVIVHDGHLMACGSFNVAGRHASYNVARWDDFPPDHPRSLSGPILSFVGPNPFREDLGIVYWTPAAGFLTLTVHDILGRRIATLDRAYAETGRHACTWRGRDDAGNRVSAGAYFLRLSDERVVRTSKILVLH